MYKATKVITSDGLMFDTEKEARKHIKVAYGVCLTKTVNKILQHEKYTSLCEFIDTNLNLFETLIELKNELTEPIEDKEDE